MKPLIVWEKRLHKKRSADLNIQKHDSIMLHYVAPRDIAAKLIVSTTATNSTSW